MYKYNPVNENYTYDHSLTGHDASIRHIAISNNHTIMVVSTEGYSVYIYRYETSLYTINQTITFPNHHYRRASLGGDDNYIVTNNRYSSGGYNTVIREYSEDTNQY